MAKITKSLSIDLKTIKKDFKDWNNTPIDMHELPKVSIFKGQLKAFFKSKT